MRRSTKLLLPVIAITVIAGVLVRVFQARIGMALVDSVVETRAGRDATAGLPDGLHIVLCGSGSPLPDPFRAGPCTLVIAGRRLFVVDTGEGSSRKLGAMGMPMGRIAGVFLTHFHSDHIDGLGPLMLLRWTGGSATTPLPVHGPRGVERVVAGRLTISAGRLPSAKMA